MSTKEVALPPPRVLALRRAVGRLLDYLRYFGLARGPPPRVTLTIDVRMAPADALPFTAADIAVVWANVAGDTREGGIGGLLPARPAPVVDSAVSAALLVACRACVLSLTSDGLIVEVDATGAPLGICTDGIAPVCPADGYAVAVATIATRAIWSRVPGWNVNSAAADADATAMTFALSAARAPLPESDVLPASAAFPPPGLIEAAVASSPTAVLAQGSLAAACMSLAPSAVAPGDAVGEAMGAAPAPAPSEPCVAPVSPGRTQDPSAVPGKMSRLGPLSSCDDEDGAAVAEPRVAGAPTSIAGVRVDAACSGQDRLRESQAGDVPAAAAVAVSCLHSPAAPAGPAVLRSVIPLPRRTRGRKRKMRGLDGSVTAAAGAHERTAAGASNAAERQGTGVDARRGRRGPSKRARRGDKLS